MTGMIFTDLQGVEWQADLAGCQWMIRAWAQEKANLAALSVHQSGGLRELRFNQREFRRERDRLYIEKLSAFEAGVIQNGQIGVNILAECFRQTPRLQAQVRERFAAVSRHNTREIDRRVTFGETMVTGLRLVRDVSTIVFMACIPASGLGMGAAMLARLAGSVFQGVGTYQDTGNIGAAVANANFAFVSSLMSLPEGASRTAQVVFTIHNTANTAVRNTAVSLMTQPNGANFTGVLRDQIISEIGGEVGNRLIGELNTKIAQAALPLVADQFTLAPPRGAAPGGGAAAAALRFDARGVPASLRAVEFARQMRAARRARSEAEADYAMMNTPFVTYLRTGDPIDLMSQAERHVRGYLLRPT